MERLPTHVYDLTRQKEWIQNCDSRTKYEKLVTTSFAESNIWLLYMNMFPLAKDPAVSREVFRFWGMVGVIATRVAFPALTAGLKYDSINVGSPRRQLALATHMSKIDEVTRPRKEALYKEISASHGDKAYGAYGLFFRTIQGKITDVEGNNKGEYEVLKRFNDTRKPIYLPDPTMSAQLADLNFSLNDVRMSNQEFETQVLPKVGVIFAGIIDPVRVFVDSKRTMTKRTIFA